MNSKTVTALVGIVGSLLLSVVLWWYFGTLVFFLFVPFVPLLFRRVEWGPTEQTARECPVCGFRTTNDTYDYCPRDGTPLEESR